MNKIKASIYTVFAALTLGTIYFIRPLLHPFVMILYKAPLLLQVILIGGTGKIIQYKYTPQTFTQSEDRTKAFYGSLLLALGAILFFAGGVLHGPYSKSIMSEKVESNVQEINTLPDVDEKQPRILPRSVAEEYAGNSLQTPRYQLGTSDIAIDDNGTPMWSMPRVPDGTVNYFLLKQNGATFVDMTTQSKQISYSDSKMEIGQKMGILDNLEWNLLKDRYFINYKDPINIQHEGNHFIAVPMIEYNFHFTFPILHTTPEYAGVALVDSSGDIDYLDPVEAKSVEQLSDQRLYPYSLSRYKVDSMQYKNGIINKWFRHEDQLEVADVKGYGNDQPYTVLTKEQGVQQFVATEPYGNANGLFEIWLIDGQTGEPQRLKLNESGGLLGPGKAMNYVRKANSRVNWANAESTTGFEPTEPLPVLKNNELYWQIRVVSVDSAGIAFTSFVNADTGDVLTAETDEEVISFLEDEEVPGSGSLPRGNPEGDERVVKLIVNGEVVKTVPLSEAENLTTEVDVTVDLSEEN